MEVIRLRWVHLIRGRLCSYRICIPKRRDINYLWVLEQCFVRLPSCYRVDLRSSPLHMGVYDRTPIHADISALPFA